jgi:gamma-glutamyl-gamma-aminobutyrate hydrolase PuuD
MPKVYLLGGGDYASMFLEHGWSAVAQLKDADLVQFTGGEDVTPALYGEKQHGATQNNLARDQREAVIFQIASRQGIPMAGICRGGQFLNVMNGGRMWQDVDGHAVAEGHMATDLTSMKEIRVTSTHHQMMRLARGKPSKLLMFANESKWQERCSSDTVDNDNIYRTYSKDSDNEVIYYPTNRCLCFQPHPEYQTR